MVRFVARRFSMMILMLAVLSILTFFITELPPGDYAERQVFRLRTIGVIMTEQDLANLRYQLGLDRPSYVRYWRWITNIVLHGNFGISFMYRLPVTEVIGERIVFTIILAFMSVLFIYAVAIPAGIYSAMRQYSMGDYITSSVGYIGLSLPNFLLALILMYLSVTVFDINVGGLFSAKYQDAPWSLDRVVDMLKHVWIPIVVLGSSGTAFQIRTMRATLLDEKDKLYVTAARAKGIPEWRALLKYPVRAALNPIVSTMGWELTRIVSGAPIVATVLALPDVGPLYLKALLDQDIYLAGALLMMYSSLTIVGTFVSDILLAVLDPRVREGAR
jgi:peptide/nickel transport system permease protein